MIQNFFDDLGIFDGGNDFDFSPALGTDLDVDIEDPFKQPCPGDSLRFGFLLLVSVVTGGS